MRVPTRRLNSSFVWLNLGWPEQSASNPGHNAYSMTCPRLSLKVSSGYGCPKMMLRASFTVSCVVLSTLSVVNSVSPTAF